MSDHPAWLLAVFRAAANRVSLAELGRGERPERVTRVVLVDETGRVYDRTGVYVRAVCQDDGQTLKVFVDHDRQGIE